MTSRRSFFPSRLAARAPPHNAVVTFDAISFSGSSDFIDTTQVISVSVLDANHQPITDPTIVADSGPIYPLEGSTSAVPEPSEVAFLLAAATTVLVTRQSRKRITMRVFSEFR